MQKLSKMVFKGQEISMATIAFDSFSSITSVISD